jgi:hypothetical protein
MNRRWPTNTNEILKASKKAGLEVRKSNGGHYILTNGTCQGSVTLASTTSNFRGIRNAVLEIKRTLDVDLRAITGGRS